MVDISGKTCIITGASSGIGRASAYALAEQGVNLVLTARRKGIRVMEMYLAGMQGD